MTPLNHADLVAAATIGTSTHTVVPTAFPDALTGVILGEDSADALLDAAAAYAVVRRSRSPNRLR